MTARSLGGSQRQQHDPQETMTEPDDLYTLRAQYWMGHYEMCLEEARAIARRPMAPHLKQEREEFVLRSHLALGHHDKVIAAAAGDSSSGKHVELYRSEEVSPENQILPCSSPW